MSDALVPVITRRGLAAVVRAQNDGLQAQISAFAVGRGLNAAGKYVGYTPTKDATALQNEVIRVPILSGSRLDPVGFRLLAQVPGSSAPAEYAIWEAGYYLETGELFCLWSSAEYPIATKTTRADYDFAYDLFLEQVPLASLGFTVTSPDIPDTSAILAELLAAGANTFTVMLAMNERLNAHKI